MSVNAEIAAERARKSAAFQCMSSLDLRAIANSSSTEGRWTWLEIDVATKTLAARDEANRLRANRVSREFPDFPVDQLPAILSAEGWADWSWHNDAMPLFVHEPSAVGVWCNFPGSDLPHEARFMAVQLERVDGVIQHGPEGDRDLFSTDDPAVLAASLPNFMTETTTHA